MHTAIGCSFINASATEMSKASYCLEGMNYTDRLRFPGKPPGFQSIEQIDAQGTVHRMALALKPASLALQEWQSSFSSPRGSPRIGPRENSSQTRPAAGLAPYPSLAYLLSMRHCSRCSAQDVALTGAH